MSHKTHGAMHEYDITLKLLLRGSAAMAFQALTGGPVERWLDIELPKMQNPRMDLLGEFADGTLLHMELQSGNDAEMPLRMAEYALGVYRRFGQFPRQIVLYVGEPVLRMQPALKGARFSFSYELRDLRDLDGDWLLRSEEVGDNVDQGRSLDEDLSGDKLGSPSALVVGDRPFARPESRGCGDCAPDCGTGCGEARRGAGTADRSVGASWAGKDGRRGNQEDANSQRHYGPQSTRARV